MHGRSGRDTGAVVLAAALALALLVALAGEGRDVAAAQSAAPVTDACPAAVGEAWFPDVDPASTHAGAIDCAAWWGLAKGTGGGRYGPGGQVVRGQMGSFLARLLRGTGGPLPASPADAFSDDDGSVHHYAINRLAAARVVAGTGDGRYTPQAPVSRAQLASFLVRTVERRTGQALPAAGDAFADDDGSVHEQAIDKAAAAGLTLGVAPGRFAPRAAVTRAQAASFLVRALDLLAAGGHVRDTPGTLRRASVLRSFDACEDLLGYLKEEAVELVGPYGFSGDRFGGGMPVPIPDLPTDGDGGSGEERAPAEPVPAGPTPAPEFSDTNVQEEGVDEADLVKTDGQQLLTVADGRLRRFDVSGAVPVAAGSLDVAGAADLLLAGDRALVLGRDATPSPDPEPRPGPAPAPAPDQAGSRLALGLVDVGAGAPMQVTETLSVDGYPLAARMVDGVARVVVRTAPRLAFVYPDGSAGGEAAAARRNREIVEDSTIADWLPGYTRTDGAGTVIDEGPLLACDEVARPPEFSGLDLLSVVTVDLDEDAAPAVPTAVLAAGQTVYASQTGLYVATSRWDFATGTAPAKTSPTTEIHAFDISDPRAATYTASGKVDGHTLNQFSMSEHDGVLRVATTSEAWGDAAGSESQVVTLRGATLDEIGRVGGLGRGERIQAVRFIGDLGYVVTYRQIDPLYTVDLSDPAAPAVRGELKILGYSAYLHPIGDGLLLGVGVDADEDGMRLGTQVSVFDVSDPADPRRLHNHTVAGGTSEVEFDHRAFLWWAATGRAVVPLQAFTFDGEQTDGFVGAVGLDVDPTAGIAEAGRVAHDEARTDDTVWSTPSIRRSLVVGDTLYTVSAAGVKASDLATLGDRAWLAFD